MPGEWLGRCLVVDSSVVIALSVVGLVDVVLVNMAEELGVDVIVPRAVYEEVVVKGWGRPGSRELESLTSQSRVVVMAPRRGAELMGELRDRLGAGESEAIALALELGCSVALDDRIARREAKSRGLRPVGTIGLLREAYKRGVIGKREFINALNRLKDHGFRISNDLIDLKRLGVDDAS